MIAADYWQPIDVQNFVAWQKAYVKTKLLLRTCDEDKRQHELEMMKMKASSEGEASTKAKAESQARA